ncbi:MAG: hypothetical protein Fur0032_08800 [Terrimicrobiaceae bacterium]
MQKPILAELVPIREVFLESRPARILLAGTPGEGLGVLLKELTGGREVEPAECDNGWRAVQVSGLGGLQIFDTRGGVSEGVQQAALGRFQPDVIVVVRSGGDRSLDVGVIEGVDAGVPVVGIAHGDDATFAGLVADMAANRNLAVRKSKVFAAGDPESLAEGICLLLPNPAKLEFARLTGARRAQAQLARSLLKSFTAVCGVIGVQPIPLADLPILTALQTVMVGLIIQTTGRKAGVRLVAEFLGALGFNIGAGLLFREGARALVRVVPFWGNAVSGFVAGAGTYAIGRAAIAYFIEGVPMPEVRKLFHRLLPKKGCKPSGSLPPPLPDVPPVGHSKVDREP